MDQSITSLITKLEQLNVDDNNNSDFDVNDLCKNISSMELNVKTDKDIFTMCTTVKNICDKKNIQSNAVQQIITTIYWVGIQNLKISPLYDYTVNYVNAH